MYNKLCMPYGAIKMYDKYLYAILRNKIYNKMYMPFYAIKCIIKMYMPFYEIKMYHKMNMFFNVMCTKMLSDNILSDNQYSVSD